MEGWRAKLKSNSDIAGGGLHYYYDPPMKPHARRSMRQQTKPSLRSMTPTESTRDIPIVALIDTQGAITGQRTATNS